MRSIKISISICYNWPRETFYIVVSEKKICFIHIQIILEVGETVMSIKYREVQMGMPSILKKLLK